MRRPPKPKTGQFEDYRTWILERYVKAQKREKEQGGTNLSGAAVPRVRHRSRERAENILKREIYRYALAVQEEGLLNSLEAFVAERNRVTYRKAATSPFLLVLRLIDHLSPTPQLPPALRRNSKSLKRKKPNPGEGRVLLGAKITRYETEMKYADRHQIHWQYLDCFLDQVGGYELIKIDQRREEKWAIGLRRDLQERDRQQRRLSAQPSAVVAPEADDWQGEENLCAPRMAPLL